MRRTSVLLTTALLVGAGSIARAASYTQAPPAESAGQQTTAQQPPPTGQQPPPAGQPPASTGQQPTPGAPGQQIPAVQPPATAQQPPPAPLPTPTGPTLTLKDAVDMALKSHPIVVAAQNAAAAAGQAVRETRSAYYPTITGDITGAAGNDDGRIGAGALSTSRLFDKFAAGGVGSQLITDLGRTPNLVASSRLQQKASEQTYQATRFDVIYGVDAAYFDVLHAKAVVRVAEQTVAARQLLTQQVTTLAQNNLRSQLDVSFADVNLADAKLLLIRAQNALQESYARLGDALGVRQAANYEVVDEPLSPSPPPNADDLVGQALAARPDLSALRFQRDAAYRFADAERDLSRPSVTAVGVAGWMPYVNQLGSTPIPDNYEGAAVNVNVPVFNGFLYSARHASALYRAMEADQRVRNQEDQIARDVRIAWANATTAYQRLDVTAQYLRSATLALNLAQGRYNLGLASIVELTQAQLNVTRAEIENLSAKYDYQAQYAGLQYTLGAIR